jgi:hypothetical protein
MRRKTGVGIIGLMMDKWIGADYAEGLAKLKTSVEGLE